MAKKPLINSRTCNVLRFEGSLDTILTKMSLLSTRFFCFCSDLIMADPETKRSIQSDLMKEMEVLKKLGKSPHPNIVGLLGTSVSNGKFCRLYGIVDAMV